MGDLTKENTVCIVNAANSYLEHGGGVAGAIRRAGGRLVEQESEAWIRKHGEVPTGDVAWTSGIQFSFIPLIIYYFRWKYDYQICDSCSWSNLPRWPSQ